MLSSELLTEFCLVNIFKIPIKNSLNVQCLVTHECWQKSLEPSPFGHETLSKFEPKSETFLECISWIRVVSQQLPRLNAGLNETKLKRVVCVHACGVLFSPAKAKWEPYLGCMGTRLCDEWLSEASDWERETIKHISQHNSERERSRARPNHWENKLPCQIVND